MTTSPNWIIEWDSPEARGRLIERIGPKAYNEEFKKHIKSITIEVTNGHAIIPTNTRFGRLFQVGKTGKAYAKLEQARQFAIDSPAGDEVGPNISTQMPARAVLLPSYISDGPGYCGPLAISIGNQSAWVTMPAIQDPDGNLLTKKINTIANLPTVENVIEGGDGFAELIYENLGENSKEFCESPSQVDMKRSVIVRWSNGAMGAIHVWGETCYVSAIHFDGEFKGETLLNLEDAPEDQFVTREAAISASKPDKNAATCLQRDAVWIIHPERGFISTSDFKAVQEAPRG